MPRTKKSQTAKSTKVFKGLKVSKAPKIPASKVSAARQLVPLLQAVDGTVLIDYVGFLKDGYILSKREVNILYTIH